MKIAASKAVANVIKDEELSVDHIILSLFDERIVSVVANAVMKITEINK